MVIDVWGYRRVSRITKGPYIYDVHTEGGWGSLEICHVFVDSIGLVCGFYRFNRSIVHFCGW